MAKITKEATTSKLFSSYDKGTPSLNNVNIHNTKVLSILTGIQGTCECLNLGTSI